MGLFGRKPRTRYVSVSFRGLTSDQPANAEYAYDYTWELGGEPQLGMRVFVPGMNDKVAAAVIAAVDTAPPRSSMRSIRPVIRVATDAEITAAQKAATGDRDAWLSMARAAAGLPVRGRVRSVPPASYPTIPPADGAASAADAGEYGRVWWRVLKAAEDAGWSSDDVRRVRSIAHRWYAIRDRGD